MTNKLVVIINSLKVPKIKNILLYEMTFLVPNYSCLQNPWLGGYRPQIPVLSVLCPQLNLLNPPLPNKIPGYATATIMFMYHTSQYSVWQFQVSSNQIFKQKIWQRRKPLKKPTQIHSLPYLILNQAIFKQLTVTHHPPGGVKVHHHVF